MPSLCRESEDPEDPGGPFRGENDPGVEDFAQRLAFGVLGVTALGQSLRIEVR